MNTRLVVGAALIFVLAAPFILWLLFREQPPEFAEVTGIVTLNGKPLDDVEVQFLPDPGMGNRGPSASCYTDKQGRYTLRCDKYGVDGATLGQHRVIFVDIHAPLAAPMPSSRPKLAKSEGKAPADPLKDVRAKSKAPEDQPQETRAKAKNVSRIPPDYQTGWGTSIRVEVKPGTNTYDFDLKSSAK